MTQNISYRGRDNSLENKLNIERISIRKNVEATQSSQKLFATIISYPLQDWMPLLLLFCT